jgi:hypothetical protein
MEYPSPSQRPRSYGLSAESFNDVQRLSAQQSGQQSAPAQQAVRNPSANQDELVQTVIKLQEALAYLSTQFERYKEINDKRANTLRADVEEFAAGIQEKLAFIEKLKDKHEATESREALVRYQQSSGKEPVDKPIDRNGVAPKDVQIGSIFNCSGKRF